MKQGLQIAESLNHLSAQSHSIEGNNSIKDISKAIKCLSQCLHIKDMKEWRYSHD